MKRYAKRLRDRGRRLYARRQKTEKIKNAINLKRYRVLMRAVQLFLTPSLWLTPPDHRTDEERERYATMMLRCRFPERMKRSVMVDPPRVVDVDCRV